MLIKMYLPKMTTGPAISRHVGYTIEENQPKPLPWCSGHSSGYKGIFIIRKSNEEKI